MPNEGRYLERKSKPVCTSHRGFSRTSYCSVIRASVVGFRRMSIALEPLEGIIAGLHLGFLAAAIGWIEGRFVRPDGSWIENLLGLLRL
jgi:hypothetical protein